ADRPQTGEGSASATGSSPQEMLVMLREAPVGCARRLASPRAGDRDPLLVAGVGVADPSQAQDDSHAKNARKARQRGTGTVERMRWMTSSGRRPSSSASGFSTM